MRYISRWSSILIINAYVKFNRRLVLTVSFLSGDYSSHSLFVKITLHINHKSIAMMTLHSATNNTITFILIFFLLPLPLPLPLLIFYHFFFWSFIGTWVVFIVIIAPFTQNSQAHCTLTASFFFLLNLTLLIATATTEPGIIPSKKLPGD